MEAGLVPIKPDLRLAERINLLTDVKSDAVWYSPRDFWRGAGHRQRRFFQDAQELDKRPRGQVAHEHQRLCLDQLNEDSSCGSSYFYEKFLSSVR